MQEIDWESRVDNVNREDIWQKEVKNWLEAFKSEETPIEKRITDYRINAYSTKLNNENEIKINFQFEVIPVDENKNNIGWEDSRRCSGFIDMVNEDGEYVVKYLSDIPEGYDRFLEQFEEWKKTNSQTETVVSQGENINLNSAKEIDKISTGIVAVCIGVLVVIGALIVMKIVKHKK